MTIMVFLQGTLIMHKGAIGKTREEIIQQVKDQETSVRDFFSYMPIGNASSKLNKWARQGALIYYLSALTENKRAQGDEIVGKKGLSADQEILDRYGFPKGKIYHRQPGENYIDVVSNMNPLPNILIEDDCESIGGQKEMTYPNLPEKIRRRIRSYVVKEFTGIDHLPDLSPSL
mgnify:FL=1